MELIPASTGMHVTRALVRQGVILYFNPRSSLSQIILSLTFSRSNAPLDTMADLL